MSETSAPGKGDWIRSLASCQTDSLKCRASCFGIITNNICLHPASSSSGVTQESEVIFVFVTALTLPSPSRRAVSGSRRGAGSVAPSGRAPVYGRADDRIQLACSEDVAGTAAAGDETCPPLCLTAVGAPSIVTVLRLSGRGLVSHVFTR